MSSVRAQLLTTIAFRPTRKREEAGGLSPVVIDRIDRVDSSTVVIAAARRRPTEHTGNRSRL